MSGVDGDAYRMDAFMRTAQQAGVPHPESFFMPGPGYHGGGMNVQADAFMRASYSPTEPSITGGMQYSSDAWQPTDNARDHNQRFPEDLSLRRDVASGKLGKLLNMNDFADRVIANISAHEGGLTAINWDDNGYGISVGIRQSNQKAGALPGLIRDWHESNPQKFNQIFGEYSRNMLDEEWVRSYDMAGDASFMERMKFALADTEFQRVQVDNARRFVKRTAELAQSYGFRSELGVAMICDMVNGMGQAGAERALRKAGLEKGSFIPDEREAIESLVGARRNGPRLYAMLQQRFSADKAYA
ncbi:MAG TPA: hypothetical protein V6D17_17740 [Candidatus Obscuribacterales bacterium]